MSHKRCHADSRSCLRCLKQGHNCDGNRPCLNCLTLGLADECADLNDHRGTSQGVVSNARSQTKRTTPAITSDVEIKPFNPDGDFVTITVSNIYTPLNLDADVKDVDKKIKGKRGPKKSETKSTPKRGTKRSRAKDFDDDEEFTCSYDESSHSTSSGSDRAGKVKPKKRAKYPHASDSLEFTDVMTYESMDGTDSMTATPQRRDSCSEDTLGEILASTCGTPIDESSGWPQLDCSAANFVNPLEEETFPTTAPCPSSEANQSTIGEQFYFGEMQTTVSFIDDAFDSNIFSY